MPKWSVREYAEHKGVTVQAIYNFIREGKLKTIKENGKIFIKYDTLEQEKKADPNISILQKEIELLRELNEQLKNERTQLIHTQAELNERLHEANALHLKTIEGMKKLEHKPEAPTKRKKILGIF